MKIIIHMFLASFFISFNIYGVTGSFRIAKSLKGSDGYIKKVEIRDSAEKTYTLDVDLIDKEKKIIQRPEMISLLKDIRKSDLNVEDWLIKVKNWIENCRIQMVNKYAFALDGNSYAYNDSSIHNCVFYADYKEDFEGNNTKINFYDTQEAFNSNRPFFEKKNSP